MTDRELLENTAKAAGYVIRDSTRWKNTVVRQVTLDDGSTNYVRWNPLIDDGDALRLAVKLRLTVSREDQGAVKAGWVADQRVPFTSDGCGPWYWKEWLKDHNWDDYAATRRAIVRAAAEIGRSMA